MLQRMHTTQAVVADIHWPTFLGIYEARRRRPLMTEVAAHSHVHATISEKTDLLDRLQKESPDTRRTLMETHLRQSVSDVLRLPSSSIDPCTTFFDLGMDSLMAVEFRRRLEKDIGYAFTTSYGH